MGLVRAHRRWGSLLAALACLTAVAGCAHGGSGGRTTSSPAGSSTATSLLPAGAIGVSPGGVTTRVDAPAESTEEEYFQACHAAKEWMDAQGGTGEAQIEPYLAMVQATGPGFAGSWNKRWAELGPERQAAVIVAAQAAGRGECG
ncbi:lipoprotein LpqV [Mycobacterium sp. TY815]|uniref:lipoprotein LpqV n=1 Tax=Mycobacterium sp. TY815 TaxID=3050581 RepID=UPI0027408078|nr:lipoprotein LpqV [Mycobacterium sp. TY815]MDP7705690.1 lipoprotein LpqV [Mycobacterium sp. TY815]